MKTKFTILLLLVFAICMDTEVMGSKFKPIELKKNTNPNALKYGIRNSMGDYSNQTPESEMKRRKRRKKGRKGSGGSTFEQGKVIISAGYGFPNLTKSVYKAYESYADYKVTGTGPIHVKFEYAVTDNIGIGLSVNNVSTKVSWNYTDIIPDTSGNFKTYESGFKFHAMAFNVRGNYHFYNENNLDIYTGIGIGYNNSKSEYFTADPDGLALSVKALIPLGLEFGVGMRYYFSENIGVYLEIGPAKSIVQAGLAIKL